MLSREARLTALRHHSVDVRRDRQPLRPPHRLVYTSLALIFILSQTSSAGVAEKVRGHCYFRRKGRKHLVFVLGGGDMGT